MLLVNSFSFVISHRLSQGLYAKIHEKQFVKSVIFFALEHYIIWLFEGHSYPQRSNSDKMVCVWRYLRVIYEHANYFFRFKCYLP